MQNRYLNLANAVKVIDRFLKQNQSFPADDAAFLQKINSRIRAIITTQLGWNKYGLLASAQTGTTTVTQKQIIEEARTTQLKTIGHTWIVTSKLLADIHEKNSAAQSETFKDLLTDNDDGYCPENKPGL